MNSFFRMLCLIFLSLAVLGEQYQGYRTDIITFIQEKLQIDSFDTTYLTIQERQTSGIFDVKMGIGRKSYNLVVGVQPDGQMKLKFKEEVQKYGNQKSFLNIRKSKGDQEEVRRNQKEKEKSRFLQSQRKTGKDISKSEVTDAETEKKMDEEMLNIIKGSFPLIDKAENIILLSLEKGLMKIELQLFGQKYECEIRIGEMGSRLQKIRKKSIV